MSRDHSQNHYGPNASFDGYDSDLASAGILIESLRQQLAAAIAACKLKDEALERIASINLAEYILPEDFAFRVLQVRKALNIQPDDSALKAWLGEPVAWKHDDPKRHDAITDSVKELLHRANSEYMHRPIDKTEHYTIPLYSPKGLK